MDVTYSITCEICKTTLEHQKPSRTIHFAILHRNECTGPLDKD